MRRGSSAMPMLLGVLVSGVFLAVGEADSSLAPKDTNSSGFPLKAQESAGDTAALAKQLVQQQKQLMNEQKSILQRLDSLGVGVLEKISEQCNDDKDDDAGHNGFPYVSLTVLMVGCGCLMKLIYSEYKIFSAKISMEVEGEMRTSTNNIDLGEFLQYRLDYYFSVTQWAKPLLLLTITFILILVSSIILMLLLGDNLAGAMWKAWTYVADPGTHADTDGTFGRVIAFGTTIGGMLVFALMIGVISDSIGEKVDDLKKGKSKVIEARHTLVLGWSEKGLAILRQLSLANQSEGGKPIVVLCEQSKEEMEEMLRAAESSKDDGLKLHGSRVIFRSGNPLAEHDLIKVSAHKARSIIALSPDGLEPDAADSRMVRQVLSLQKIKQTGDGLSGHIVVELQDVDNKALVQMVGKGDVEVIVSHDLIGRMMLLSARSPWLATVLDDLMGFEGSEFYLKEWKELFNKPFGSVLYRFDSAVPVGVKQAKTGRIMLNPPDDMILQEGDMILVLAEDDDTYNLNENDIQDYEGTRPESDIVQKKEAEKPPERLLFCGWRRDMADMICELDYDVPPGSELWLFNNVPMDERAQKLLDKGNKSQLKLKNITMKHVVGNPVIRRELISLVEVSDGNNKEVDGFDIGERTGRREVLNYFTSILILSDCSEDQEVNSEASDSRSVATTLIIQDIQRGISERKHALGEACELSPPISEILDSRTRSLMQLINKEGYQGYVLSNHLVASALAMVSEDRYMNKVYGELLSCQGNQIQIRKARDYINIAKKEPLSFWDVSCLARMSEEIAIGYIPVPDASMETGKPEVRLNPPSKGEPRVWNAQDRIIVIAMCRQAKYKHELRLARAKAESDLYKQFSSGGNEVPIHGWLKKLNSGKENEMDNDDHWRDRLCFVMNGKMAYASEKKKGETEPVCDLDKIKSIQPGNGWPPGYNTFKLEIEGSKSTIFSATTTQECGKWIVVLSRFIKS